MPEKKRPQQRHGFRTNEYIVYPAHGVGRIVSIEEQEIAGAKLELFVINFEKDKMTLRVPTSKLESVGMRKLSEEKVVKKALTTLKGKARVKRTMWSRRAQEYEAKINSGDLISIAEVVRDLYRSEAQPEQSYSERQLYEAALDRMARELAAVEKLDEASAIAKIDDVLAKSARHRQDGRRDGDPRQGRLRLSILRDLWDGRACRPAISICAVSLRSMPAPGPRSARDGSPRSSARSTTRPNPARARRFPARRSEVETGRLEHGQVLPLDRDGEVVPPILGEVHVDPFAPLAHRVNRALDKLIGAGEPAQALHVARVLHAIGPGAPNAPPRLPRRSLAL